jgi:hypothetical protein
MKCVLGSIVIDLPLTVRPKPRICRAPSMFLLVIRFEFFTFTVGEIVRITLGHVCESVIFKPSRGKIFSPYYLLFTFMERREEPRNVCWAIHVDYIALSAKQQRVDGFFLWENGEESAKKAGKSFCGAGNKPSRITMSAGKRLS